MQDLRDSQTPSHNTVSSFGVSSTEFEHPRRKTEHAYSFVGMHCIFDECKSMGNFRYESVLLILSDYFFFME